MRKNLNTISLTVLVLWVAGLLFATRYHMLDDALIHLNYARYLHDKHFITFDGVNPSFGTSSLLYVSLLACLRSLTSTPMLSKLVSLCAFIVFVFSMLKALFRMSPGSVGRTLMAGTVVASCSVMGVRWLTDGMETGLSLWAVFVLCCIVWSEVQQASTSWIRACLLMLFGLCFTLLRIEYAILLALSCMAILITRRLASKETSLLAQIAGASYLGLGAVLAELLIFAHFKSFLPDTAFAKSAHHASIAPLGGIGHILLSSFVLGIGTLLVWLLSVVVSFADIKKRPSAYRSLPVWLTINCSFPLLIFLACARSQSMQGVRYVLWAIIFSIFLNALQLADVPRQQFRWFPKSAVAVFCAMLLLWPMDTYLGLRSMLSRAGSFTEMRDAHLDGFAGQTIVAGDVGFVAYFTHGKICDTNGLVNGRVQAALTKTQRIEACVAEHPTAVFMNGEQASTFNQYLPIRTWKICKAIDFQNVLGHDWHYLATSNERPCPNMASNSQTLQQVIPGLAQ